MFAHCKLLFRCPRCLQNVNLDFFNKLGNLDRVIFFSQHGVVRVEISSRVNSETYTVRSIRRTM